MIIDCTIAHCFEFVACKCAKLDKDAAVGSKYKFVKLQTSEPNIYIYNVLGKDAGPQHCYSARSDREQCE